MKKATVPILLFLALILCAIFVFSACRPAGGPADTPETQTETESRQNGAVRPLAPAAESSDNGKPAQNEQADHSQENGAASGQNQEQAETAQSGAGSEALTLPEIEIPDLTPVPAPAETRTPADELKPSPEPTPSAPPAEQGPEQDLPSGGGAPTVLPGGAIELPEAP